MLVTAVYLLGAAVNSLWLPSPATICGLLLFSLWIGAAHLFLRSDLLVPALRVVLHFAATGLVFWLTFGVLGGYLRNGGYPVVLFVLYAVVYALASGISGLIRAFGTEADNGRKAYRSMMKPERGEYVSQFSDPGKTGKNGRSGT